jgi:ribosomal protein S27E
VDFTVSPIGQDIKPEKMGEPEKPVEFNIDYDPFRKYEERTVVKQSFRSLRCPKCGEELYVVEYYDDGEAFVSCTGCSEYYYATVKQGRTLKIGRFIIGTGVVFTSLRWEEPVSMKGTKEV